MAEEWVLDVDGETRRPVAFFTEVEMAGPLSGFWASTTAMWVGWHVEIQMALAVRGALFDGRIRSVRAMASPCRRSNHPGVNHEEVGRAVAENEEVVGRGIEDVAVRAGRPEWLIGSRVWVLKKVAIAGDEAYGFPGRQRDAMPEAWAGCRRACRYRGRTH